MTGFCLITHIFQALFRERGGMSFVMVHEFWVCSIYSLLCQRLPRETVWSPSGSSVPNCSPRSGLCLLCASLGDPGKGQACPKGSYGRLSLPWRMPLSQSPHEWVSFPCVNMSRDSPLPVSLEVHNCKDCLLLLILFFACITGLCSWYIYVIVLITFVLYIIINIVY